MSRDQREAIRYRALLEIEKRGATGGIGPERLKALLTPIIEELLPEIERMPRPNNATAYEARAVDPQPGSVSLLVNTTIQLACVVVPHTKLSASDKTHLLMSVPGMGDKWVERLISADDDAEVPREAGTRSQAEQEYLEKRIQAELKQARRECLREAFRRQSVPEPALQKIIMPSTFYEWRESWAENCESYTRAHARLFFGAHADNAPFIASSVEAVSRDIFFRSEARDICTRVKLQPPQHAWKLADLWGECLKKLTFEAQIVLLLMLDTGNKQRCNAIQNIASDVLSTDTDDIAPVLQQAEFFISDALYELLDSQDRRMQTAAQRIEKRLEDRP